MRDKVSDRQPASSIADKNMETSSFNTTRRKLSLKIIAIQHQASVAKDLEYAIPLFPEDIPLDMATGTRKKLN